MWSLIAWAVAGLPGLLRVDLNSAVLAVLSTAELIMIIILTVTGLSRPAGASPGSALAWIFLPSSRSPRRRA